MPVIPETILDILFNRNVMDNIKNACIDYSDVGFVASNIKKPTSKATSLEKPISLKKQ